VVLVCRAVLMAILGKGVASIRRAPRAAVNP